MMTTLKKVMSHSTNKTISGTSLPVLSNKQTVPLRLKPSRSPRKRRKKRLWMTLWEAMTTMIS